MIVNDIMKLESLNKVKLISGESGLYNTVTNITFIDAPDGYKWCTKGDLIITSGYLFSKQPNSLLGLLKVLKDKKCSGLGLKFGRYIFSLSEEVIQFSNDNKIPILSLPSDLSWSEISNPILNEINKYNTIELENTHSVYKQFHYHLLHHNDIKSLIDLLKNYFPENDIIIYLRSYNEIVKSDGTENINENDIESIIAHFFNNNNEIIENKEIEPNTFYTLRWIVNNDSLEGVIIFKGVQIELNTWQRAAIEQAHIIVALRIERFKTISNTLQKFKNDFLLELLNNEVGYNEYLVKRAADLGWQLQDYYTAILIDFKWNHSELFAAKNKKANYIEVIQNKYNNLIVGLNKNNILTILVPKNKKLNALLNKISRQIEIKVQPDKYYIGVGDMQHISSIHQAHHEAELALKKAKSLSLVSKHKNKKRFIKKISDIGVERILYTNNLNNELHKLNKQYLEPLLNYDKSHNGELLDTLNSFLKNMTNYCTTAKELNVHENTVRYRLKKIEEVLNVKFSNFDTILLFKLLISAYHINQLK